MLLRRLTDDDEQVRAQSVAALALLAQQGNCPSLSSKNKMKKFFFFVSFYTKETKKERHSCWLCALSVVGWWFRQVPGRPDAG